MDVAPKKTVYCITVYLLSLLSKNSHPNLLCLQNKGIFAVKAIETIETIEAIETIEINPLYS